MSLDIENNQSINIDIYFVYQIKSQYIEVKQNEETT